MQRSHLNVNTSTNAAPSERADAEQLARLDEILAGIPRQDLKSEQEHLVIYKHLDDWGIERTRDVRKRVRGFVRNLRDERRWRELKRDQRVREFLRSATDEDLERRYKTTKTPFVKVRINQELVDRLSKTDLGKSAEALRVPVLAVSPTWKIFVGSDGDATSEHMRRLERLGLIGEIAAQLFRAQKCSSLAKKYFLPAPRYSQWRRGFSTPDSDHTYDQKDKALCRLCELLGLDGHGLQWGWGKDPQTCKAPWVLYVELPRGQVSFHTTERKSGPAYDKDWDGTKISAARIMRYCDMLLDQMEQVPAERRSAETPPA